MNLTIIYKENTLKLNMPHDIKKTRPNGRYKAGQINPDSCRKLYESQRSKPIIYRSSYERDFVLWLERSRMVIHWGSECVGIGYTNVQDGKHHTYYPDYIMEVWNDVNNPNAGTSTVLVEIKPYSQTKSPDPTLPRDSYAWKEYIRNMCKWKAALEFAKQNNMQFKIFTERTISRLN